MSNPSPALLQQQRGSSLVRRKSRTPEDVPIKVHKTPFRVRVQKALAEDYRAGLEDNNYHHNQERHSTQQPLKALTFDENEDPRPNSDALQDIAIEIHDIEEELQSSASPNGKVERVAKLKLALEAQKLRTGRVGPRGERRVSKLKKKGGGEGGAKKVAGHASGNGDAKRERLQSQLKDLKREVMVKEKVILQLTELAEVQKGKLANLENKSSKQQWQIEDLEEKLAAEKETSAKLRKELATEVKANKAARHPKQIASPPTAQPPGLPKSPVPGLSKNQERRTTDITDVEYTHRRSSEITAGVSSSRQSQPTRAGARNSLSVHPSLIDERETNDAKRCHACSIM